MPVILIADVPDRISGIFGDYGDGRGGYGGSSGDGSGDNYCRLGNGRGCGGGYCEGYEYDGKSIRPIEEGALCLLT